MNKELISIVVPVYNVEKYLDKCVKSIIDQTYDNLQIILVDDGSKDNSGKLCDLWGQRDRRIITKHKDNGGLSDARNYGVKFAEGKYVMFVDSDDIISEYIVEYLMKLIYETNSDISICDPLHCYPEENIVFEEEKFHKVFSADEAVKEMLYQKSFLVSACAKIYRKEYFDNIKFPVGMLFEDSATIYKIFECADRIVYGDAKLYGYMHRENSITTKKFSKADCDILYICDEIVAYMDRKKDHDLIAASLAYQMSAAFRIYLNAPRNNQFNDEIKKSEDIIKTNSYKVLLDKNVRRKAKIAIIMFACSKKMMIKVYKHVDRWK